jgi:hypothetical protein
VLLLDGLGTVGRRMLPLTQALTVEIRAKRNSATEP